MPMRFACVLLFTSVAAAAEPELFRCVDADGVVSLQDDPCPVVAPKAAPKAAAKPAPKPAPKAAPTATSKAAPKVTTKPPLKNVPWEPTWNAFVTALKNGDRPGAIRCLTAQALTDLGPRIEAASPESLVSLLAGYQKVVVEGDLGPYWSIRVLRGQARPKWIFFERTPRGEWKIAAI